MKNHRSALSRIFFAFVCIALLAVALPGGGLPAEAQQILPVPASPSPGETQAPDQLLLRFRPGVSRQRADEILAQRGLSRLHRIEALDVDVLRLPPGLSVERAMAIYGRHPEVEFAEPNYVLQALEISDQWGLEKVRAAEAWPLVTDPAPVLLATVDTGIDRNHTDLAGNIWTSPDESASNGIDDDDNGYVDDTWGWDFVNNDNDPMDDMMHGTAVSSVSAGVLNGTGVAGVCPWCQLMSVKVLDATGSGYLDTVAQGITYAADNGARVINLSLGATAGAATLEQAVTYAWGQGAVVVAAAGNNGLEELFYPAAYQHAMAVGSTNEEDYRSCFSNYSADFITVTAPGEAILAATPNQGYGTYSGTSLAAPHVTGLAGLLFSQDPTRTNDRVWALIEQSAVDLGPQGKDGYFGSGRVDAYRAVSGETSPTTPPAAFFTDDPTATGYAHARKVARDGTGTLHWVWHTQQDGQYQVLYTTSSDGGQTWTPPEVVFSSSAETYHPALAVDDAKVYIAFPSKHGSAKYRVFFSSKALDSGTWPSLPDPVLGGTYDAVRPDLHVDADTGNLHLVASSLDNAPNVYYTWSDDYGANWQTPTSIPVGYNSRYADVYAHAGEITLAVRTVEFWFMIIPRYHLRTFHSSDGGDTWQGSDDLATHDGVLTGEYGLSLSGVGNQLTLAYEHAGNIHFGQSSDGLNWALQPDPLGAGAWPTLTQAGDGRAWALWDRSSTIIMRHYTGSAWEAEEVLGTGTYPNLKAGISGNVLEWVVTRCSAPYCLTFDSKSLGDNDPPVANDVADSTDEDSSDAWSPAVNDPNGDTLTCSLESSPGDGSATVESDCSGGTYTPAPDFSGTDTFTYRACDPGGLCDSGTVTYEVKPVPDAPVADDQVVTTPEDTPVGIVLTASDVDGDPLAYSVVIEPVYGALSGSAPNLSYSPNPDYSGPDSFAFQVSDGPADSNVATVSITVSPVNDAPVAAFTYGCTGLSCAFDGSASDDPDGTIASYHWNFGAGQTAECVTASHTYGSAGTYTVLLTVTDDDGAPGTVEQDVAVGHALTVHIGDLDGTRTEVRNKWDAEVTITVHDAAHEPVEGAAVSGTWSEGATGTSQCTTGAEGNCTVAQTGISKKVAAVTFTVDNVSYADHVYDWDANHDDDFDSDGTSIIVPPPVLESPVALFDYFCSDLTCTFDASESYDPDDGDLTGYDWDFGDGGSASDPTASHTYAAYDTYLVSLTVTDDEGATGDTSQSVTVSEPGGTMHISDLDGLGAPGRRDRWDATVIILVYDGFDNPLANATVTGIWSEGAAGGTTCVTDGNGLCSVTKTNLKLSVGSVTWMVDTVTHASNDYDAASNNDPDGDSDSDGSTIVVTLEVP